MSTAPNASPPSSPAGMERNAIGDDAAPNSRISRKNSTRFTVIRTATEMTTPSTICVGRIGEALMPVNVGFHLYPSMIGYVNSSLATVMAALASRAGATNTR